MLVGLSGGADSVALLDVLCRGGYTAIAAHCNFHLRGEESNRDEQFVRRLCEQKGVKLIVCDFDTKAYAEREHKSIELAARDLRYAWFEEQRQAEDCVAIAVAHHQNDQAETVIMNLRRGCGLKGLQGMRPRNGKIIRPLLCTTHDYIQHYLRDIRHIEWVEDSTNSDTTYRRNAVREMMQNWTKAEIEHVAKTAEIVQGYVDGLTEHYGIIGNPLAQSFSANHFNRKFRHEGLLAEYSLYPLEKIEDVVALWERIPFKGMNVTIPYKVSVIPYLDELDETAKTIGAVNVIAFDPRTGKKKGYNTDALGFIASIREAVKQQKMQLPAGQKQKPKAIVLGSGGASKACVYGLKKLGYEVSVASREPKTITGVNVVPYPVDPTPYSIVVNATPLGMYPNINTYPDIDYDKLTPKHLCFDCVYNPEETEFLRQAKEKGAQTINGMGMLVGQAEEAWKIWDSH